jgi:hypothetical protein
MSKRPTNQELCAAFRDLITIGCPGELREPTRPWRNELWKAFREIEDRLCPTPESARRDDKK